MSARGAMGIDPDASEPLYLDNTGHPAANRFALARATSSHVQALGLAWDDTSGRTTASTRAFSWRSA